MDILSILYFSKRAISFAIVIGVIFSIYYFIKLKITKSTFRMKSFLLQLLYVCYISALIQITIIRDWDNFISISDISYSFKTVQYIPFATIKLVFDMGIGSFIYHVFGNMFWFVPLGFLTPMISKKFNEIKGILILSFIFSFTIELFQFFFNSGVSDIDDIILNVLGSLLGYSCYRLCRLKFRNKDI